MSTFVNATITVAASRKARGPSSNDDSIRGERFDFKKIAGQPLPASHYLSLYAWLRLCSGRKNPRNSMPVRVGARRTTRARRAMHGIHPLEKWRKPRKITIQAN